MPAPITIADLMDYLQQYDQTDPVVLLDKDMPDNGVSMESTLAIIMDHRADLEADAGTTPDPAG